MNWLKLLGLPALAIALTTVLPNSAQAQITAGGDGTAISPNGSAIDITGGTQAGSNLFHSFGQFNVEGGQTANFVDPGVQNILGRVTGGNASLINGVLQVTGGNANLYLMNPAGIIFGSSASLDVLGSFTATTANGIGFEGNWFNAIGSNEYANLIGNPNSFAFTMAQPGTIANAGNLGVGQGQSITLLGGTVINTGTLSAPEGRITVAAVPGEKLVSLSQGGNLLSLALPVETGTTVNALPFTPLSLPQLLAGGNLGNATGVTVEGNVVRLTGSGVAVPTEAGTAIVSNAVDVAGAMGGTVHVLGDRVGLVSANIDASGINGGGTVLVGGDYKGQGTVSNASRTYVSQDSVIAADGLVDGNGGRVIAWADDATEFYGSASVRGGSNVGNGGFVEVSGQQGLVFDGTVDLSAENGNIGTLLLDPTNITIVAGADGDGTDDSQLNDGAIFATDPGDTLVISRGKLEDLTGNIILEATNDITIADGVSLNFIPRGSITLTDFTTDGVFVPGGSIMFTADAGVRDGVGSFSMDQTQSITAPGRNITISGASITAGNIYTPGGEFNGSVSLSASEGAIEVGDIVTTSDISVGARPFEIGGAVNVSARGNITTGDINTSSTYGNSSVTLHSQLGDIIVNTITTGEGNDFSALNTPDGMLVIQGNSNVDIDAYGNFQARGSFRPYFETPARTDLENFESHQGYAVIYDPDLREFLQSKGVDVDSSNFYSLTTDFPISILTMASEEAYEGSNRSYISIKYGSEPRTVLYESDTLKIEGGGTPFIMGPNVDGKLRPIDDAFIEVDAFLGLEESFQRNERYSALDPNVVLTNVSGTVGAIGTAVGNNAGLFGSLRSRVFAPDPKPDPIVTVPPSPTEGPVVSVPKPDPIVTVPPSPTEGPVVSVPKPDPVATVSSPTEVDTPVDRPATSQEGQSTQIQLSNQGSSCVPSGSIASAAGVSNQGSDRSGRANSSANVSSSSCNTLGGGSTATSGSTADDTQILKLLDGGVR